MASRLPVSPQLQVDYYRPMTAGIFTAHSTLPDTASAVRQAVAAIPLESAEFVLLLHGPGHTGAVLEQALPAAHRQRFFGSSTSGEIVPQGYQLETIAAISFDRSHFSGVARKIEGLTSFRFHQARELVLSMQRELRRKVPGANSGNTFALLLIDGLSQAEEYVAAALGNELGSIHLVGGSSGDNWQLQRSPVLCEGAYHDDSAVVLLVHSSLDFRHYNFHNFKASDKRGVITAATPAQRLVHEINGITAVREYARLCDLDADTLDQEILAVHPAIITVGDRAYPRGFMRILADGSLQCACAIDEGVVFRVATQVDYVEQLRQAFRRMQQDLGGPLMVLGFECAARRQIVEQYQLQEAVYRQFEAYNVWGFSCMGEQANSLNMNNSFNCLAFRLHS